MVLRVLGRTVLFAAAIALIVPAGTASGQQTKTDSDKSKEKSADTNAKQKENKQGKSAKSAASKKQTKKAKAGPEKQLTTEELVYIQPGELPIIFSAPHGGVEKIKGVPERKGEGLKKGPSGFFAGRDGNTELLAKEIADVLESKYGKKPYFVIARFHRKYIDANRPPEIAYESPNAKPVYDLYHGTLAKYCTEVHKKYGRGILFDVHGQGSANDTLFRGTRQGKTVELLRKRFGETSHVGPKSFFGLLNEKGMKVFPLDDSKERAGFTGGHIVGTYGSHTGFGIDAIQLEFGGDYRKKENLKVTAQKVADAIVDFAKLYLEVEPKNLREEKKAIPAPENTKARPATPSG